MKLSRTLLLSAAIALYGFGCSSQPHSDTSVEGTDGLTEIPETPIRNQAETGNCWIYATVAWAESVTAAQDGTNLTEYSTAYLVYWDYYRQITNADRGFRGVDYLGGSFGEASELILNYGLVAKGDFVSEDSEDSEARLAERARVRINESLRRGPLKGKNARRDPAMVRRELDKAFRLEAGVVSRLDAAFGENGATTLTQVAEAPQGILDPKAMRARAPGRDGSTVWVPLAELIGTRVADDDIDARTGPYAWSTHKAPAGRAGDPPLRAFIRRAQRALHAGLPVPFAWCVVDEGAQEGEYRLPVQGLVDECAHQTLLVDYEAKLPDGRILRAGEPATAEDMQLALHDKSEVLFLRVRNSWGTDADGATGGYTDLYFPYLESRVRACPGLDKESEDCEDWPTLIADIALPQGY